jgi:hypothetical protein
MSVQNQTALKGATTNLLLHKPNSRLGYTFDQAKKAAIECLDACPTDFIRQFVNRPWRFIDAYRKGLTGDAAAWAVKQQKGHQKVSQRVMMQIASIVNYVLCFFCLPTPKEVHTIQNFTPKIWPQLRCRGKNFGGGFVGSFEVWESESEL